MADEPAAEPLSFLDAQPEPVSAAVNPTPEAPNPVTPAVVATPVVKAVEEAPAGSEAPAPKPDADGNVADKDGKMVPLGTFLDMRDRAKAAEDKLKAATPPENDFVPPDPVKNPVEYAEFQRTIFELNILNERMNTSEVAARRAFGSELVDKAKEWAGARQETDPAFGDKLTKNADPYGFAIEQYQEHLEYEEFRAAKAAKGKEPVPVVDPNAPAKTAVIPKPKLEQPKAAVAAVIPKSINDAPSQGGTLAAPVGGGQAFDSVFGPAGP